MIATLALIAGLLLAFANGANDNFKGVATLYGSAAASYRRALIWATLATALGSICAVWLASELLSKFSGKGIVSEQLASQGEYGVAVALGAAVTVLFASRFGFPISTTHALVGAMVGAAAASKSLVHWNVLGAQVLAPLLLSPLVAILGTAVLYSFFHRARIGLGVQRETCLCAGQQVVATVPVTCSTPVAIQADALTVSLGTDVSCRERYAGNLVGIEMGQTIDSLHFVSAGLVSFARGLNDTPKIAALLLIVPLFSVTSSIAACGVAIALGGVICGRRIAETLSQKITVLNPGQGFAANVITSLLAVSASRWGLPVSTTHVSCGALFGVGIVTGGAHRQMIAQIVLAWITTLPVAAVMAAIVYLLMQTLAR